jgi:hypothetical protein
MTRVNTFAHVHAGYTPIPGQGMLGVSVSGFHAAHSAALNLAGRRALSVPRRPTPQEVLP